MTVDKILNNRGVFTTLGIGQYFTDATFDRLTGSVSDTIDFTNLPAGQDDILVEFSLALVPEPATRLLLGSCVVGFAFARRKLTSPRTTVNAPHLGRGGIQAST